MVKRHCPKCNAEFDRKSNFDAHINKKFDCGLKNNIFNEDSNDNLNIYKNLPEFAKFCQNLPKFTIKNTDSNLANPNNIQANTLDTNFVCSYCQKKFSTKYTLSRHIDGICKIKKENDNQKENIFKLLLEKDKENKENKERIIKLEEQNKLLMKKIDKLISMKENSNQNKITNNNILNSNSNSNNITNSNNTQNNIVMVNFGNEDLSIIDKKQFMDRIVKKPLLSGVKIPDEVLKIIHFNPDYPQLSNIYISDINRDKCMVWEDGEWKLSNVDNIPQIMDKICLFSSEQINNLKDKYPNNKPLQDRLVTIEKYNNLIDIDYLEDLKDDEEIDKNIIKRCENFQKHTYDTIKKTLYNEGKKLKKTTKTKNL